MTRPIVWAVGAFAAVAVSASLAGTRLATLSAAPTRPAEPERRATASLEASVVVMPDRRGHYTVEPSVDGRRVLMLVDTGASLVSLTAEDAAAAGLRPSPSEFSRPMSTANGVALAAPVRIREMRLQGLTLRDVEAVVMPPGRLGVSLLGMSFLRRLRGFEVSGGALKLRG